MRLRALLAAAGLFLLAGCLSGPQYVNLVHPDHDGAFQQVATTEKAQAFYANTTLGAKVPVGDGAPVAPTGIYTPTETPIVIGVQAEYFAPNGWAFAARQGSGSITTGRWYIDQFGRSYPRLCRVYDGGQENCSWPSSLLRSKGAITEFYRGDVLNLQSGRFPSGLRSTSQPQTIASARRAMGLSTSSLKSLQIEE